jgi:hypothetical protein
MVRSELDIDNTPGVLCSACESLENASNVVALAKGFFETLSLLVDLGIDVLLLCRDSVLQLFQFLLESFELINVGFQLGGNWSYSGVKIPGFRRQG